METEGSLPCSREPPLVLIISHNNPVHTLWEPIIQSTLYENQSFENECKFTMNSATFSGIPSLLKQSSTVFFSVIHIFIKTPSECTSFCKNQFVNYSCTRDVTSSGSWPVAGFNTGGILNLQVLLSRRFNSLFMASPILKERANGQWL